MELPSRNGCATIWEPGAKAPPPTTSHDQRRRHLRHGPRHRPGSLDPTAASRRRYARARVNQRQLGIRRQHEPHQQPTARADCLRRWQGCLTPPTPNASAATANAKLAGCRHQPNRSAQPVASSTLAPVARSALGAGNALTQRGGSSSGIAWRRRERGSVTDCELVAGWSPVP